MIVFVLTRVPSVKELAPRVCSFSSLHCQPVTCTGELRKNGHSRPHYSRLVILLRPIPNEAMGFNQRFRSCTCSSALTPRRLFSVTQSFRHMGHFPGIYISPSSRIGSYCRSSQGAHMKQYAREATLATCLLPAVCLESVTLLSRTVLQPSVSW